MKLKLDNGQVLSVKLVKDDFGCIDITVTKVNGEEVSSGILLSLKPNGKFSRIGSVNSTINIERGTYDKIKEDK